MEIILFVVVFFLIFYLVVKIPTTTVTISNEGRDSTDPVGGVSGMSIFVDHKTGLQYLGRYGGLTPRLNKDGSHMSISDDQTK